MKTQIIIPVACVAVGAAVGFMAAKGTSAYDFGETPGSQSDVPTYRSASVKNRSSEDGQPRKTRVKSLEEALSQQTQTGRLQALMDYFERLDSDALAEEADKLGGLPMGERMMVSFLLFSKWGEDDPLAAMSYSKTMGRMGGFVNGMVLKSWATSSPEEAADYYTVNSSDFYGGRRGGGMSSAGVIASEWALQDKDAALAWALKQDGADGTSALNEVFRQVAGNDPGEAVLLLNSINDEAARISAQKTLAREWGASDWLAAESWISSLPVDQQKEATAEALRGLSDQDYLAAAEKLADLGDAEGFADTMESIARDWSKDDPAAASAWVMANGTVEAQKESIGVTVSSWARVDSVAAYEFVSSQEIGEVRDEAVSSYIESNLNGDTNQNLDLAETVTDNFERARAIAMSVSSWMQDDKEAATDYVSQSEFLTDEMKERVIQRASGNVGGRGGGRRR